MTRTRAAILAALVACAVVVGVILASSGGDDGSRSFMAADDTSALLVEWTRVGDDLSGSLTQARLAEPAPVLLGDTTLLREKPREMQQGSSPFTGTVSRDSVRLRLAGSALGTQLNGQLDGDTLKLIFTQDKGPETIRLNSASRKDFDAAVARLRAADATRSRKARAAREQADAKAKAAITRVATAYQRALDPGSSDDPCRYLSAAAKGDIVTDRTLEAPAGGCTALVRFYQRGASAPPKRLGAAEIELRTLVRVPGGSGGNLADGAELRFAAMRNEPIGLVHEDGQWRIAEYR
jgi:hypothetical protein